MRFRVLPYRQGSRSATALAEALNGRVLRLVGSTFRPRANDVIINWGNTNANSYQGVLNLPEEIRGASNKRTFFERMAGTTGTADLIPPFWTRAEDIPDDAFPVVCRTVLAGHSGDGIVIADDRAGLVRCNLYVKYIKKESEYRIHVGILPNGQTHVIAEQKKVRRADAADVDFRIRNHAGGFIFQRNGIEVPDVVRTAAVDALRASGLDFGAVDVIFNRSLRRPYVLEINTAPGLEGQTVTDYQTFFNNWSNL